MEPDTTEEDFQLPIEYRIDLALESGAHLTQRIFNHEEHHWTFTHRYRAMAGEENVVNDYRLDIGYANGEINTVSMMMAIVFPQRRGKEFMYGLDISKNSKLTLTFEYDKIEEQVEGRKVVKFKLGEIIAGCCNRVDLRGVGGQDKSLLIPVDFPFPVLDVIELDWTRYRVPFLSSENPRGSHDDAKTEHFVFPQSFVCTRHPVA